MPPGKVSRYPKTRKSGAPASSVRRQAGTDELMAQARYDWNKATPGDKPTLSPRKHAKAVARTPGAAESLAQGVYARTSLANADAIPHKTAVKTRYRSDAEAMRKQNALTPAQKEKVAAANKQKPKLGKKPPVRNQGKRSA